MWLGACTSSIGTWMQILAQNWLVYDISHSSVYLGLDSFFGQIPIFLFSLFGGVFADRKNRRTLLLISQFIQLTCAFLLAVLVATHVVRVPYIWCLSFTVGLAQSFGGPAYSALVPSLVQKEDLQNAIALNSIQFNLARVVGPALGGVALAKLGASWCFTLNGISFLAVIASLLAIHSPFTPPNREESVIDSMKEGVNYLRYREGMVSLVALAFLITFLAYPLITFLLVIVRNVFHGGPNTFTVFLCLSGAGSIAGALFVASSQSYKGQARRSLLFMLLLGLSIAAIGLSKNVILTGAFIFVAGLLLMVVFALNSSLVQLYVPDIMRGRVMSVYNVAFRGGMPFGSLMSGLLIKGASVLAVMTLNGVLLVALGLYFLFVQRKLAKL